jgi:drug/metabolite transporter (DMT)-like permease
MNSAPSHLKAILLGLLVTTIWSTSWVLIKIGLEEIPALTFAGLRYVFAFLCLLPFVFSTGTRQEAKSLSGSDWLRLAFFGVILYTFAQGGQFLALAYLPSVSVSLILNLTSIFVAFSSIIVLKEKPSALQWSGVGVNLLGILIYFYPGGFQGAEWLGIFFAVLCLTMNIAGAIMGRGVNRGRQFSPLLVTVISMGFGSILMLVLGLIFQGLPEISLKSWGIIVLLAVINTAFAFTLWNYTLQTLTATESSLINSTMVIQVAILTWIFLGERLDTKEIIGLILAALGVFIVQIRFMRKTA